MKKLSKQQNSRINRNVIVFVLLLISLPIALIASSHHQQIKQEAAGRVLASNAVSVSPPASFVTPTGSPQALTCGDCLSKNPNSSLCLTSQGKQSFCQDNASGNPSTPDNVCVNCVPPTPTPTPTPTPAPFTINYFGQINTQVFPANIKDTTFKATPQTPVLFTQTIPLIGFNPFQPIITCSNLPPTETGARPMLDVIPQTDGSCTTIALQGNGHRAGAGADQAFDAVFTGNFIVNQPGRVRFSIYHDDGWILGIGSQNSNASQPNYVSGDMINAPTKTVFQGYPVVGSLNVDNQPGSKMGTDLYVYFPAAGIYPFELDYFEVADATLSLVVQGNGELIVPVTINPSATPPPGCYYTNSGVCPSGFGCLGGANGGQQLLVCPNGNSASNGAVTIATQKQPSTNIFQLLLDAIQKIFSF